MSINTIESLRSHLQWALEIEHATLPPYLYALYSIKDGHNIESREIIESVFMEEMLHMTLVANILNAVGGKPVLDKPEFIPQYPSYLPHSNKAFQVPLMKLSKESIEVFLKIEQPETDDAQPQDDEYATIGQFYNAIELALTNLCEELGEENVFTGDPARQIRPNSTYYGGSGVIIAVEDLASALAALDEVIEQGEGMEHHEVWDGDRNMFHPERMEVAHYFRFQEILYGHNFKDGDTPESGPTGEPFNVEWDQVYNCRPNTRTSDYEEGSEIHEKLTNFNKTYSAMLRLIEHAFDGQPAFLATATGAMYDLKAKAKVLMETPSGDGETTVGVSFEYMPPEDNHHDERILVRENGPYIVYGNVPLVRKEQVISEHGEPLTWRKKETIPTEATYALCRCGQSTTKPFCDGTHVRNRFDGTETAPTNTTSERLEVWGGEGITVKRDFSLCMESGFCGNRLTNIRKMVDETGESTVRAAVMAMIERCPSGSYTYSLTPDDDDIEPDFPIEIAITAEGDLAGPIWITGNIPIERADGQSMETRPRVTLCRCGLSGSKPLCDGTHREKGITE
jgi:CDGSH-type Zn-finger protein/rubrerythrin